MSRPDDLSRLVVVTAVKAESRAVLAALTQPRRIAFPSGPAWSGFAGTRPVTLVQAGIGPLRAHAALTAVTARHGLVVSIGFAGALVPTATPGDVVLPGVVAWEDAAGPQRYVVPAATREAAHAALPAGLARRTLQGTLFSSPVVVASPQAKRAAAVRFGAVAVEMEVAGLVDVARDRGVDVLVVRAILDTVDVSLEQLPADLDSSWRARAQLLGRPGAWPGVLTLARHVPQVARTLSEVAAAVLPIVCRAIA